MNPSGNSIRTDVAVIGGGPVGSYAALRLAKKGYDVTMIEEDGTVGRPQQCAGLVNSRMFDLPYLEPLKDDVLLNRISGADILSPAGRILELRGKETKAYSMDRAGFDLSLFRTAARVGVKTILDQKAVRVHKVNDKLTRIETAGAEGELQINAGAVLGCEGTSSLIRRAGGIKSPRHVIPGLSMEVIVHDGANPTDLVCVITGRDIAKGFFSWSVPAGRNGRVRIGLAAIDGAALRKGFGLLLTDRRLKDWLGSGPGELGEISWNYGSVPMGSPSQIYNGNMMILGDSAGMAKPTSGGGIFPGLLAVDTLMGTIDEADGFGESVFVEFRERWKKGYGRELERSRVFRNIISRITDEEIELVIDKLSSPDLLDIINDKGDIDHPIRLALSLLKKDPSLLKLVPRFLPHLRKVI